MADELGTVDLPPMDGGSDDTLKIETETRSEDAPWGLKPDGTPYKVDPTRYRTRAARAGKKTAAKKAGGKSAKKSPYRESVLGVVQIIGLPLAALGARNDVFLADSITLSVCAPGIADAVDSIAQTNPKVAQALDKLAEVGPFGLFIAAMAPLVIQVGANHGLIPAGVMGAVEPDKLIEAAMNGELGDLEDVAA